MAAKKKYPKEMQSELYFTMLKIRKFEEKAEESFAKGILWGGLHMCIGQEACDVGAVYALESTDYITSTHRGHGHALAKGFDTGRCMAEIFGKKTGYCGGKGGSMHIADAQLRSLGANGIVGAGIPIAAGSALASKVLGDKHVTLCFFGDAASNQGGFHEAMNMAAAWKLPVVFFCENNGYGISVAIETVTNTKDIAARAKGYDVPGKVVDGNDVFAVYEAIKEAVEHARAGNGPSLIEGKTFRHKGHFYGDSAWYRPAEYMEKANAQDAIARMRKYMLENGFAQAEIDELDQAVFDEIQKAYEFAVSSDYPDPSEAITDVYSADNERCVAR